MIEYIASVAQSQHATSDIYATSDIHSLITAMSIESARVGAAEAPQLARKNPCACSGIHHRFIIQFVPQQGQGEQARQIGSSKSARVLPRP